MTGERDIVRFAFPFTAGILLSTFIPAVSTTCILCTTALLCVILIALMLYISALRNDQDLRYVPVLFLALLTGTLCMITDRYIGLSNSESLTFLERAGSSFCENIRLNINSMGFASKQTDATLSALITGDRSSLSRETIKTFRDSGASHILALSGLHLGIIYGIIRKLSAPMGNKVVTKRIRSIMTLTACGFYTLATGAGESIVRAFLFIMMYEIASLSHRPANIRLVLPAALVLQLAADPSAISSASFQLSYAAMAGIAYIYPHIQRFWPEDSAGHRKGPFRRIWETAAISISCQLTTAPLVWHYFGSLPQHFLLSNLIALPLTGLLIPLSLLGIFLHGCGMCPNLLTDAIESTVNLLRTSLETISEM